MTTPSREEVEPALEAAAEAARAFLAALDTEPAARPGGEEALAALAGPLPEEGDGALAAIAALGRAAPAATRSAGPRFFHFVTGGVTPAALGADWLASALDQNAFAWVSSPLGARAEGVAVDWLKDLFGLPPEWAGVVTTGATAANFTALAAARRWWGAHHGADVEQDGLAGLPPVPVLSSGYVHTSALKALAMLGIGRGSVQILARDDAGTLDLDGLERALAGLSGAPAILLATAGEVDAGGFDPLAAMADLADRHGAWLHVDGAFGLFARVAPEAAGLAEGVERANSVIADGHKWLNVPYDCGFAFVRERGGLTGAFGAPAAYLPADDEERPSFGFLGPELSRRARGLAVWATLRAYGRAGYRDLVESHLALARRLADAVRAAPGLELLAEPRLNVVTFRHRPPDMAEEELDRHNARLGAALLADGRVFAGTTRYRGMTAFRPAIVNWRTRGEDVDLLVEVLLELGAR